MKTTDKIRFHIKPFAEKDHEYVREMSATHSDAGERVILARMDNIHSNEIIEIDAVPGDIITFYKTYKGSLGKGNDDKGVLRYEGLHKGTDFLVSATFSLKA